MTRAPKLHSVHLMDLRIFVEPQQGASYDDQLAIAQESEALGFDAFFRSDHYLRMGEGSGAPGPTDAWITLAGLARETSTIRLGTMVTPATFRLPGPLAISVAEVDAMSGGRVELGLGGGWYDGEHTAYGIPFPRARVSASSGSRSSSRSSPGSGRLRRGRRSPMPARTTRSPIHRRCPSRCSVPVRP